MYFLPLQCLIDQGYYLYIHPVLQLPEAAVQ